MTCLGPFLYTSPKIKNKIEEGRRSKGFTYLPQKEQSGISLFSRDAY
ncbi:MAG: hypothetical protein F6K24_07620 [Okeania sp. SIO2D1]|nr:hypothetical protein [Okeania sp. SIO2D1]